MNNLACLRKFKKDRLRRAEIKARNRRNFLNWRLRYEECKHMSEFEGHEFDAFGLVIGHNTSPLTVQ